MKKSYINPTTEVITLQTSHMIAASPNTFNPEVTDQPELSHYYDLDDELSDEDYPSFTTDLFKY